MEDNNVYTGVLGTEPSAERLALRAPVARGALSPKHKLAERNAPARYAVSAAKLTVHRPLYAWMLEVTSGRFGTDRSWVIGFVSSVCRACTGSAPTHVRSEIATVVQSRGGLRA
jgi:hypothetical protein